jgi:hypothetical protein
MDLDAHLADVRIRRGDVLDGVAAGGVVDDGLHGGSLIPQVDDQG